MIAVMSHDPASNPWSSRVAGALTVFLVATRLHLGLYDCFDLVFLFPLCTSSHHHVFQCDSESRRKTSAVVVREKKEA
jgi:hypothetical protein